MPTGLEIDDVSTLLGIPVDTINNYRRRYGLFPDVETSRGRSALYGFAAVLRLKLVQRLTALGFSPSLACRIISEAPDVAELFREGKPLKFGAATSGGVVIHGGFDPICDTIISLPVQGDGADLLASMYEKILQLQGKEAAERFGFETQQLG